MIVKTFSEHIIIVILDFWSKMWFSTKMGAAVAEWLSSWLAEQEVRGSILCLAT